ncbi:MAG: hypothetical protein ACYSPI_00730, partial [Planctomycetota bacterium]
MNSMSLTSRAHFSAAEPVPSDVVDFASPFQCRRAGAFRTEPVARAVMGQVGRRDADDFFIRLFIDQLADPCSECVIEIGNR